jgi:hypothetical protein
MDSRFCPLYLDKSQNKMPLFSNRSLKLFFLLLSFFLFLGDVYSQQSPNPSAFKNANKQTRLAIKDILGTWVSADSAKVEIEFAKPFEGQIQIKGIKHGVGDYYFLCSKDSLNVNGTAPNWPPYDCTLNLTTKDTLEIYFYQYFYTGYTTAVYTRKRD